jgi:TetR/AcrR family transcriptional regulator
MHAVLSKSRLGSRGHPQKSRAAILQAAVREFSREGVAGARIDAIARAARVNKALLYYYFKDKEALYGEVLDQVFTGLTVAVLQVLSRPLPPRKKILAYVKTHFDYVAAHPLYPRLVQAEMMRAGRSGSTQLERVVQQYFRPLYGELAALLAEGRASGDFRAVDPLQFIPSMISVIIFYFNSAPVVRLMTGADPMSPAPLSARRAAVLDFISAALFRDGNTSARGGQP